MAGAYEERSKAEVTQLTSIFSIHTATIELNRLMVSTDYEQILQSSQALEPSQP
jgi:hypothetical protein